MDIDLYSCARLLQSCNTHHWIQQGRQLHLLFLKRGVLNSALTITNRLLQMYIRCTHLSDAQTLFDEITQRNIFTWNTIIEGYMKSGDLKKSWELFDLMPEKNEFSWNLVVSGYAKVGELDLAQKLFNEMPKKNGIVWNSMIHGYARSGRPREAMRLFKDLNSDTHELSRGDTFVLTTVVGVCTDLAGLNWGKQIHGRIVVDALEFDSVLGSSLVNMYGKLGDLDSANYVLSMMQEPDDFALSALISGYANCGRANDARRIFDSTSNPCVAIWNSMISGYVANDEAEEALLLHSMMRKNGYREDSSTFSSVLTACNSLGVLEKVEQIHAHAIKFGVITDIIVASSLVDTYAKCGRLGNSCKLFSELESCDTILLNSMITVYSNSGKIEEARLIFETMPTKSLISWNSMIVGFSQNGCPLDSLDIFCKMNKIGLRTDKFSLASVISACGSISLLVLGEQLFARATVIGLVFDQVILTSLIDFYCKCGFVENGRKLFDQMIRSDQVSWNSMLMGYATNGYGIQALSLFKEMIRAGVGPTDITFIAVLSVCDHCGFIDEGKKWFYKMKEDYNLDPTVEHYSCMIDLFARAGFLEEALNLTEEMPFEADASMWASVLRGCVAHGDKTLGKKVAERITGLDPKNSGAYVQLSSVLATFGDWEGSERVRKLMEDKRIEKNPGRSWAD